MVLSLGEEKYVSKVPSMRGTRLIQKKTNFEDDPLLNIEISNRITNQEKNTQIKGVLKYFGIIKVMIRPDKMRVIRRI